jgi:GTP-binding nuclear protein Ran
MAQTTYNFIIAGDGGVGKTSFINRYWNGNFSKQYIATIGKKEYKSKVIDLTCIDVAGQEKYCNQNYGEKINGAIIMFDVHSRISYDNIPFWYEKIVKEYGNIPIVICGNKVDRPHQKVKAKDVNIHRKYGVEFYFVSAKSMYNYEKPFSSLMKQILLVSKL